MGISSQGTGSLTGRDPFSPQSDFQSQDDGVSLPSAAPGRAPKQQGASPASRRG